MKKIVSLALAMLLGLSLAACGSKNSGTGDVSDALTLLNTVWATYSEEEKFPVSGGDYDHPVDDAPGAFDISNADNMDYMLGFPGPSVANLVDAASLPVSRWLRFWSGSATQPSVSLCTSVYFMRMMVA